MISVENFYWAVWDQMLKPHSIFEAHFYPFGTTSLHNLVRRSLDNSHDPDLLEKLLGSSEFLGHIVWFYDQEPLEIDNLNDTITLVLTDSWDRYCRILASSEISLEKKQFVKQNHLLDWYYFYHGFAALDWYRDAQYITTEYPIEHNYISLNHLITGDRAYRMALTARLVNEKLDNHGLVSFHHKENDCVDEINNQHSRLSIADKLLIKRNLPKLSRGLYVDKTQGFGSMSALFGHNEYQLWQSAMLHVVNETVFYHDKLHLTEKVFKPIVAGRPFVLVAAPGNLAYLRKYGFQTFEPWIDESYDQETNHNRRLNMITKEIAKFAKMSSLELNQTYQEMQQVLEFNKQHFYGKFKEIIIDELIQNFAGCINQWNNGRFADRCIITEQDFSFDQVRARLKS